MGTYINNIKNIKKTLQSNQMKVIEVTKTNYTLENGDVYEHTFDIDEDITVEEFQTLLDNAKTTFLNSLNKIENDDQLWEKY
jgi:arabinogalactan endo-1,4-beta-galactosidase